MTNEEDKNPAKVCWRCIAGELQGRHVCDMPRDQEEQKGPEYPENKVYQNIVEWLYLHDGNYGNKTEWRKEFLAVLKKELS